MILQDGRVRKLRKSVEELGYAHELTFSCYQRRPLLGKDRTRGWLLDALDRARREHEFELWAYVIMPEHVHVLLLPRAADFRIASILKTIKQSVSRRAIRFLRAEAPAWVEQLRVTRPSGRSEYRFWQQGGGYDRNFVSAEAAWTAVDYLHNNPVRRGLADCPTDWPWSSACWYAGVGDAILEMDGCPPTEHLR